MGTTIETAIARAREVLSRQGTDDVEKTIFASPAGKKRLAVRLAAMLPAHKAYVEPFAGSAAVLFAKEPAAVEAIGDADPEIAQAYRLLKGLTAEKLQSLRRMKWTGDLATYKRLQEAKPSGDVEKLYRFLYLSNFSYPHTLTFQPAVQDPVYRRVDVRARAFFGATHATQAQRLEVAADIRQRLRDHFRISNPDGTPNRAIDFGFNIKDVEGHPSGEVALSDVFDVVRDTPGVRKLGDRPEDFTLDGRHADIRLTIKQFPVLGSVELVDGDSGGLL